MTECFACALTAGELPLPGGRIHQTKHWIVEHCVGPLGLGALVVKPERHVTAVADLTPDEATELGPLLQQSSAVAGQLADADQVYNCLWSHADGTPVHIHYVVQPVTRAQMAGMDAAGPQLQVAMISSGNAPAPDAIEEIAARARRLFAEPAEPPPPEGPGYPTQMRAHPRPT